MKKFTAAAILFLTTLTLAWGGAGTPKKEDVPKYLATLKNSTNAKDRAFAAEMLGKRGAIRTSDVKDALEPLQKAMQKDSDANVRRAAAEALGNIGTEAETVVPLLLETLKDKNVPLKLAVITSLSQYGAQAKEAVPALRAIVQEKTDKKLSMAAAGALKAIAGKKK